MERLKENRDIKETAVHVPRQRPLVVRGVTRAMRTGCGNLYVTVNLDEKGRPFEVFNHMGKAGGCAASQSEAIGRLVSLALRCNIAPEEIIKQLKGISCHQQVWGQGGKISSCADAIAKALESTMREEYEEENEENDGTGTDQKHEEKVALGQFINNNLKSNQTKGGYHEK